MTLDTILTSFSDIVGADIIEFLFGLIIVFFIVKIFIDRFNKRS